ncbi:hypothetical protein ONE63_000073 [Megalurothrips usitatus]|uniref:Uncharacterized protein n=1 Tax=Megalurothrips usitatus TaxID=439358 RepID=A0AAV7Y0T0_9NEOP|nr:hypothetical protein ONE63_000073 [Megalurothrips usitatus]
MQRALALLLAAAALCGPALAVGTPTSSEHEHREPPQIIKDKFDGCLKDLGLTKDVMKGDDKKPKMQVHLCVLKKDGVISADGKFAPEKAIAHFSEELKDKPKLLEKITAGIEKCTKEIEGEADLAEEALAEKILDTCFVHDD